MFQARKKHLIVIALVLGVGAGGGVVYSAETAMNKDAFKAAKQRIAVQAKAQRKACDRFKGNAKDVCDVQAKGWEKIAKAQLALRYKPGPESEKMAKFARADVDYEVAKQRCEALKDRAHDTCIAKAKHDREAAVRLAKVEKVEELNALRREDRAQREAQQKAAPPARKS
ncbi:hypothetical protein [Ramlibacter sp. AN1133]|uniref:hypothetical protein n=1 Tax=Ramlibacter sp. AN1133 TaxID=3133429 RepID=UPI0030C24F25